MIIIAVFFSNSCPHRQLTEELKEWTCSYHLRVSSLHSNPHLFNLVSFYRLRKSYRPPVFISNLSMLKFYFLQYPDHWHLELYAISNNLVWFFTMFFSIAFNHLIRIIRPLCSASYLLSKRRILALPRFLIRHKHFFCGYLCCQNFCLFILVCYFTNRNFYPCFFTFPFIYCFTFFGFVKYWHLLLKELSLVEVY